MDYHNKNYGFSATNNLLVKRPDIAKEWDYVQNYPVRPEDIAPNSNKPRCWICPKGHSYPATPNNRCKGKSRCSHCYIEENNLVVKNPELAKQWHPTKNADTPDKVPAGRNEMAWWLCPICDYEWEASINNRNKGRGCPECKKGTQTSFPEQVIFHYTKELFPDAVNGSKVEKREIDIYIPSIKTGIEYDGEYHHRTEHSYKKDNQKNEFLHSRGIRLIRIREKNCHPMGSNLCEIYEIDRRKNYTDLQQILQGILNNLCTEYNIHNSVVVNIEKVTSTIKAKIYTVDYDDSLEAFIKSQERNGTPVKAIWDYEANYPLIPEMVTPKTAQKLYWICKNNPDHKWPAPVYSITDGCGCPKCSGRNKTTEEWIEQAKKVHGNKYEYSKVDYKKSDTPVEIICYTHGVFQQDPSNHLSGNGCPYCAGQKFHPKESLAVMAPDIAKEWDYELNALTPEEVGKGDGGVFYWKCNNGKPHSYKASVRYRTSRNSGCGVCSGKQVSPDTCLEFLRPDLVAEWDNNNEIKPSEVTLGSEIMILWKCSDPDHEPYQMAVGQRAKAEYGCQICSGRKKTHKSFSKELKAMFPKIILVSQYQRSDKTIDCLCEVCGHKWSPIASKLLKSRGCPMCVKK